MADGSEDGRRAPTAPELVTRYTTIIEEFVLRARRIEAHSLAQDGIALERWAQGGMGMLVRNGDTFLTFSAPPEEQMESAAARVRPLLLSEDPVYVPTVFKALTYLLRENESLVAGLREQRKSWEARVREAGTHTDGYRVMSRDPMTAEASILSDRELAYAWLYGDVVHHDLEKRSLGDKLALEYRYRGAVALLAFLMRHALSTLRLIRDLRGTGLLLVGRQEVFDAPVVVTETRWEYPAEAYVGDVGVSAPDGMGDLGPGWQKWGPSGSEATAE